MTGRWYWANRVKKLPTGTYMVIGNKIDITEEIEVIIHNAKNRRYG